MKLILALLLMLFSVTVQAQSLPPVNSVPLGCANGKALVWSAGTWNCSVGVGALLLLATTGPVSTILPRNGLLLQILVINTTGNPLVGGMDIGTTLGAHDIISNESVGGNAIDSVADAKFQKRFFSALSPQNLFVGAQNWNGASLNITIVYLQL